MKKLLLLSLCALLLLSLVGCFFPSFDREPVTEDPPVRNPEETYIETVEEATIDGSIQAICGENLIRISLPLMYRKQFGDSVYVQLPDDANLEALCKGDGVSVKYNTIEKSKNPNDIPTIVAISIYAYYEEAKPVIYFYPEAPTKVSVTLTLTPKGRLTCTYPDYEKGWQNFTAHPDGTLIFPDGKEYYCLYWEGMQTTEWDFSTGFCVKGPDTAAFLEWALAEQGLTAREANEFIIYWLPLMQENPYNVISFQTDAYTDGTVLEITPTPDSLIRVFMAWYATDTAVELLPQAFDTPVRDGYTVVEWGGSQVKSP